MDAVFDSNDGRDQITEWIEASGVPIPVLAVAGREDYVPEIFDKMVNAAVTYDPVKHSPDFDHMPNFEIDPTDWYENRRKPVYDQDGDAQQSIPHNNITHLIITNDFFRLDKEINTLIPEGYLLIHGSVTATKYVCECEYFRLILRNLKS